MDDRDEWRQRDRETERVSEFLISTQHDNDNIINSNLANPIMD